MSFSEIVDNNDKELSLFKSNLTMDEHCSRLESLQILLSIIIFRCLCITISR